MDLESNRLLDQAHGDLQVLFERVSQFYKFRITCSVRNEQDQNAAYNAGYSKLKYPDSKHNKIPSMAVDVYPVVGGKPVLNKVDMLLFAGRVAGIADMLYQIGEIHSKLRIGADWNSNGAASDEKFLDVAHFEII